MTENPEIERRAAAALRSDGGVGIGELDMILTDGAAEAMVLRSELLRINRRLAAALDGDRDLEALDRARELADRRSELRMRWEHLSGLLTKLRDRRDRLAARHAGRGGAQSSSQATSSPARGS